MKRNDKKTKEYVENDITLEKNEQAGTDSPVGKEKLSRFDLFRAITGVAVIVTFAVLWYTSDSLSEINDTFLAVTSFLFALYLVMFVTELVRLKRTSASLLNCVCTIALLIFVFCVMTFRLDYMCAAMETKPVETEYLRILENTPSSETEILEAAKQAYITGRVEPMKKVGMRFYVLSLISLAVTGIPTLIVYLLDRRKKSKESSESKESPD